MPYLYASPDDHFCQLRGFDEDGDEGGDEDGGPVAGSEGGMGVDGGEERLSRRFWDGSRDRWISVVSARVDPDEVRAPPAPAPLACAAASRRRLQDEGRRTRESPGPD